MVQDYTDRALEEWQTFRPELDASASAVVNRVLRLAQYLRSELDEVGAAFGLSTKGDFDTLAALRRHGPRHELSPTQLAEAALITTGGMTSRLDRLEDGGLVERRADPSDRRALLVCLTDAGRRVVDEVLESSLEKQQYLLEGLSPDEIETLARILRQLLVHLGDE